MTPKTPEEIADKHCAYGLAGYKHPRGSACLLVTDIRYCVDSAIRAERARVEMAKREIQRMREQVEKAEVERDELRKELEAQQIRWSNLPTGPDMDADENNQSPEDAVAHESGLAIKSIEAALRALKVRP